MKTTVMFVADSVPLDGVSVCLAGGDDENLWVTDAEGKIELELDLGQHTFRVNVDDRWVERTISRQGHAPLFVVNVRQNDAQSMATLNTLQIDLSNLVGDRYVFETVLGRGGMGVVVKAVDRMLNRPVAIKMLSDELRENEEAQQIFLVEARNLATLSHPNLVAIHDILNVGGRVLMVFEYVLGENVEKTLKKVGALPQKDVLRIAIQLTRCVSYLHEHELIHRDLKPANIIMQADGTLKLIDFGLARSLNELYVRGTRVRGTPAYMAPEQIQGIHLTTATDIYQLGISIYEMLNGGLPFNSGDMAYAHVHLEPPPLATKVPGLDEELARLVHACLAKQPKDRPGSAEILLEQLQQIYARLASGAPQPMVAPLSVTAPRPAPQATDASSSFLELEQVSLADEVVGGSNRGLAVMGLIGLSAMLIAGYVMFAGGESETPPPTAEAPAAIVAPPGHEPSVKPAPEADPMADVEEAVLAARGLTSLAIATATGRITGMAAAERSPEPPVRKVAPAAKPVERRSEPAVATREKPVRSPNGEGAAKAPKPAATEEAPEKTPEKKSGLLSVDDGKSKSLLPVSN